MQIWTRLIPVALMITCQRQAHREARAGILRCLRATLLQQLNIILYVSPSSSPSLFQEELIAYCLAKTSTNQMRCPPTGMLSQVVVQAEHQGGLLGVVARVLRHPQAAREAAAHRWGAGGGGAGCQDVDMDGDSSQDEEDRWEGLLVCFKPRHPTSHLAVVNISDSQMNDL